MTSDSRLAVAIPRLHNTLSDSSLQMDDCWTQKLHYKVAGKLRTFTFVVKLKYFHYIICWSLVTGPDTHKDSIKWLGINWTVVNIFETRRL